MTSLLSESTLRAACGQRVWARALELLEWPALSQMTACGEDTGWEVFGRCHGSEGERYALRLALREGTIGESSCSCAFDGKGLCKHLVALGLALGRDLERFRIYPPLPMMVASCSHETLADLVAAMVRREPELLSLLAASRGSGDEESVRDTLRRALSGRDARDGQPTLERVWNVAGQMEARGEWAGAGDIWSVALEELAHAAAGWEQLYEREVERMEGYHEEDFDFGAEWAKSGVEGLSRALEEPELAPERRHSWMRSLWEAERAARECEYFSLPPRAYELLARFASNDLWADIEARVRSDLKKKPSQREFAARVLVGGTFQTLEIPSVSDWERQRDVGFLGDRLRLLGQNEEAEALVRELGTATQRFDLFLKRRDFVSAAKLAREAYTSVPHRLIECATRLEEAGASDEALEIVLHSRKSGAARSDFAPAHLELFFSEWLCDFYLRHNRASEARTEAVRAFAARPDDAHFARLKEAVEINGEWSKHRDDIEREVRSHAGRHLSGESREGEVTLALALGEGDADRIYALFEKFPVRARPRFLQTVASGIEAELPAKALPLWRELAEWCIENRDPNSARRAYVQAAQHLKRARELYDSLGLPNEWRDYIQTLRGVYSKLRALQEELCKAGL